MHIPNYPLHVGLIPDGNRRWANKSNVPLEVGYVKGIEVLESISKWCLTQTPIEHLTVYGLSSENILRAGSELSVLFDLYEKQFRLICDDPIIKDNGIRVRVIGDTSLLPDGVRSAISEAEKATSSNSSRFMNVALGYGGREELLNAFKSMFSEMNSRGLDVSHITEQNLNSHLYTNGSPYPDLIIRTAENRLSNFLLWQSAYSEFVFIDKFFPDITVNDMENALFQYSSRERRFGK